MLDLDFVREALEKIKLFRQKMKNAQFRQKTYADKRRRDFEFDLEYQMLVKVSPMRDTMRFGKTGK